MSKTLQTKQYEQSLNSRVYVIRHAALHDFAMDKFSIMLECHSQILLGRDLRFGGHLFEG